MPQTPEEMIAPSRVSCKLEVGEAVAAFTQPRGERGGEDDRISGRGGVANETSFTEMSIHSIAFDAIKLVQSSRQGLAKVVREG